MIEANIYLLGKTVWVKSFPKLLEQIVAKDNRVQVFCDNEDFMQELDELLWTFEQLSFIPHATMKDKLSHEQPIILSTGEEILNRANILALTGKRLPANIDSFSKIIFMFEGKDKIAREVANSHINFFQSRNINCNYFRQSDVGSWERVTSI